MQDLVGARFAKTDCDDEFEAPPDGGEREAGMAGRISKLALKLEYGQAQNVTFV
jgi:hypothetical protein